MNKRVKERLEYFRSIQCREPHTLYIGDRETKEMIEEFGDVPATILGLTVVQVKCFSYFVVTI